MRSTSTVFRALMIALLVAACGGGAGDRTTGSGASPLGPQLTVERFLQLANQNDWSAMADLFGTARYTIAERDGPERAERHMQLIASLLRHDDFTIAGRRTVAGNPDATRLMVEIQRDGQSFSVPFVVVPRGGGWIVERIENLEALA